MTDYRFPNKARGRACKILRFDKEYTLVEFAKWTGFEPRFQRVQAGEIEGPMEVSR